MPLGGNLATSHETNILDHFYEMSSESDMPSPPEFLLTTLSPVFGDKTGPISIYAGNESSEIPTPLSPDSSRPYVTLTFAQSLDAKIAGKGGLQLALSGKESLVMTHWFVALAFRPYKSWLNSDVSIV